MATRALHIFLIYLLISIVHPLSVSVYLPYSDIPGGDVGMLPILIFLIGLLCTGVAAGILLVLYLFKIKPNYSWVMGIYFGVYYLVVGFAFLRDLIVSSWSDPSSRLALYMVVISLVLFSLGLLFARYLERSAQSTKKDDSYT